MGSTIVKLGRGDVAVTGGLQFPDNDTLMGMVFFEPDKGSGLVSGPSERSKGDLVFPHQVNGTILEFSDPMSIDVVIEQLSILRCDWNRAANDPQFRSKLLERSRKAEAA